MIDLTRPFPPASLPLSPSPARCRDGKQAAARSCCRILCLPVPQNPATASGTQLWAVDGHPSKDSSLQLMWFSALNGSRGFSLAAEPPWPTPAGETGDIGDSLHSLGQDLAPQHITLWFSPWRM